jgi:hypothetical protein
VVIHTLLLLLLLLLPHLTSHVEFEIYGTKATSVQFCQLIEIGILTPSLSAYPTLV